MSPRGDAPFTIEQFAVDLHEFVKRLGITSAVILGFSDGANIAMKYAMSHPETVRALILNGGNLNARGVKRSAQIPIEIGYKIAKHFAKKSPEAKKNAEMLGLMVNEPNISTYELSKIIAPTLVICGTRDMIKKSHTKMIAQSIPNATLSFIKGDHFIPYNRPDAFNREVDRFLTRSLS